MSDDKVAAVKAEVQRLLDAKVIREVKYPTWLANTIPVKKKNGKWQMCIVTPGLQKDINRAIIYVPGSSHTYIQQNEQYITAHIT